MAQAGSLAFAHDALLPSAPGGMGRGALLALVVHAGLLVALTGAVDWRTQPPSEISAELWASVPQSAAPPPPVVTAAPPPPAPAPAPAPAPTPAPPPPTAAPKPPEPDIAAEQSKAEQARKKVQAEAERAREIAAARDRKRAEAEKARAEAEKTEKAKAEKAKAEKAKAEAVKADKAQAAADKSAADKKAQADEARLAQQREENLKRIMGQAGSATGRSGTAAQEAAPSAAYAGLVAARVRERLVYGGTAPETATAEVLVRATASGTIIARQLTKSSGHADYDEAILRAIDKLNALPANPGGTVPSAMTLVFRRRE